MKQKSLTVRVDREFARLLDIKLAQMGLQFQPVARELLQSWLESEKVYVPLQEIPRQATGKPAYNSSVPNESLATLLNEVLGSGHEIAIRAVTSNLQAFDELIKRAKDDEAFHDAASKFREAQREAGEIQGSGQADAREPGASRSRPRRDGKKRTG